MGRMTQSGEKGESVLLLALDGASWNGGLTPERLNFQKRHLENWGGGPLHLKKPEITRKKRLRAESREVSVLAKATRGASVAGR